MKMQSRDVRLILLMTKPSQFNLKLARPVKSLSGTPVHVIKSGFWTIHLQNREEEETEKNKCFTVVTKKHYFAVIKQVVDNVFIWKKAAKLT